MFLIPSMLTQLSWFRLENHCSQNIVVRSAISQAPLVDIDPIRVPHRITPRLADT
jgi:hypothetical protein